MKKTIIWIISVLAVASVLVLAYNFFNNRGPVKTISVSGECTTTAPKDKTAITIEVRTMDSNPATSMKIATAKMSEITAFLKTLDIDMQTTRFDSYEKTEWDDVARKSVVLGTETVVAVEVSSDTMENIEIVLARFAGQPDIYTNNLRMFTSAEKMKPAMESCLESAVDNARSRANAIAAADNKSVGKLISATYGDNNTSAPYNSGAMLMRGKAMESSSFDMAGGFVSTDTEISVSVGAVFEIK